MNIAWFRHVLSEVMWWKCSETAPTLPTSAISLGFFAGIPFWEVYREMIDKGRAGQSIMALKLKATREGRGLALHDGFQIAHFAGGAWCL